MNSTHLSKCLGVLLLIINWSLQADVSTLAQVRGSGDIKVADNGDLYVSDFGNPALGNGTQVLRVTPSGEVEVFASGLPRALAGNDFDSQGNLIQAAFGSNRIYNIDPDGNTTTLALLTGPVGIAIAQDDTIYSTQCQTDAISRVDRDGTVTVIASGGGMRCPNGLDFGHDGALYTVNNPNGGMYRIGLDGAVSLFATIPGGGNGHVVFVGDHYYIAGRVGHRVYQVDTSGNVQPYAGTGIDGNTDGPNLTATVSRPNGIGASPDGKFLYIVGSSNFTAPQIPLRRIDLPEVAPTQRLNAGLAGAWFDPQASGQGVLVDIVPTTGQLFLAWFTYARTGEAVDPGATIGAAEHRWFTAQGPFEGTTADLDILISNGGFFDDPTTVTTTTIGSATLEFVSCTEAQLDYQFDDSGASGQIQLTRLSPDELCGSLEEG